MKEVGANPVSPLKKVKPKSGDGGIEIDGF